MQTQVADDRLLIERSAILPQAGNARPKMRLAAQPVPHRRDYDVGVFFSKCHHHAFSRGPGILEFCARIAQNPVYGLIGRIWVVMKENQVPHAGSYGDTHAFAPARMSPSAVTLQLLWGVLRVIDKNIGALG